jgi:hypothetical protein
MDLELAAQYREVWGSISGLAGALVPGGKSLDIRKTVDAADGVYDLNSFEFTALLKKYTMLAVKGWKFRDNINLVRYHTEIAQYFQPVEQIRNGAELALSKARSLGDMVIGVHIRQGDYRGWKNGSHYFETEQYAHWMKNIAALDKSKKTAFMVCSSDPVDPACFRGLDVIMGPGSVIGDLHALSLCDRLMGPPSTFSAWASFHGRKPLCMLQHHRQEIADCHFTLHDRV